MSGEVLQGSGSTASRNEDYSLLPTPFAWIARFEHSVAWLAAAAGSLYLLIEFVSVVVGGRPSSLTQTDLIAVSITYALCFAGLPLAIAVLARGLERDVRDLAPVLGANPDGMPALLAAAFRVPAYTLWIGAGVGVLVACVTLWVVSVPSAEGSVFVTLRELAIDIALFGSMGWATGAAMRLSQLTEQRARPDLLDPRAFAALARHGTRLSAVWLAFQALSMPLTIAPPTVLAGVSSFLWLLAATFVCFAAVALILPCRGAHRVLRSAKQAELAGVRDQIAEARRTREDTRLPGLIAWEARIEGFSEWPIDAAALGRTGLFVLLPVASWVASAFVERLVDASLR